MKDTNKMWFFELATSLVGVLLLVSPGVISKTDVDVQGEINRITDKLNNIEPPNQMMIDAFVQQVQTYCPNRTIGQQVYTEIQTCMDRNFNNTELEEDIREAIPAGKLDEVFHDMCIKWPKVKGCMGPFIELIEDCWAKGDKVTKVMDSMVNFFCGDNNDGARIALFFADGGMRCMEERGEDLKDCITKTNKIEHTMNDLPTEDDICGAIRQTHDCVHKGLRKCDDSTPENLVSSMLKVVAKSISCPPIYDPPSARRTTDSGSHLFSPILLMVAGAVLLSVLQ